MTESESEIEVRIPKQIFTFQNIVAALGALGVLGGGAAMAGAPSVADVEQLHAAVATLQTRVCRLEAVGGTGDCKR